MASLGGGGGGAGPGRLGEAVRGRKAAVAKEKERLEKKQKRRSLNNRNAHRAGGNNKGGYRSNIITGAGSSLARQPRRSDASGDESGGDEEASAKPSRKGRGDVFEEDNRLFELLVSLSQGSSLHERSLFTMLKREHNIAGVHVDSLTAMEGKRAATLQRLLDDYNEMRCSFASTVAYCHFRYDEVMSITAGRSDPNDLRTAVCADLLLKLAGSGVVSRGMRRWGKLLEPLIIEILASVYVDGELPLMLYQAMGLGTRHERVKWFDLPETVRSLVPLTSPLTPFARTSRTIVKETFEQGPPLGMRSSAAEDEVEKRRRELAKKVGKHPTASVNVLRDALTFYKRSEAARDEYRELKASVVLAHQRASKMMESADDRVAVLDRASTSWQTEILAMVFHQWHDTAVVIRRQRRAISYMLTRYERSQEMNKYRMKRAFVKLRELRVSKRIATTGPVNQKVVEQGALLGARREVLTDEIRALTRDTEKVMADTNASQTRSDLLMSVLDKLTRHLVEQSALRLSSVMAPVVDLATLTLQGLKSELLEASNRQRHEVSRLGGAALLDASDQDVVLTWLNFHLREFAKFQQTSKFQGLVRVMGGARSNFHVEQEIQNFTTDLANSEALLRLMVQIVPKGMRLTALQALPDIDLESRALKFFSLVAQISPHLKDFAAPHNIVNCVHSDLVVALLARLMIDHVTIPPLYEPPSEVQRECKTLISEINSLMEDMETATRRITDMQQEHSDRLTRFLERNKHETFATPRDRLAGFVFVHKGEGDGDDEEEEEEEKKKKEDEEKKKQQNQKQDDDSSSSSSSSDDDDDDDSSASEEDGLLLLSTPGVSKTKKKKKKKKKMKTKTALSPRVLSRRSSMQASRRGSLAMTDQLWLSSTPPRFESIVQRAGRLLSACQEEERTWALVEARMRNFALTILARHATGTPITLVDYRRDAELELYCSVEGQPGDDPSEVRAVRAYIREHFKHLKQIFRTYASEDDDPDMSLLEWVAFVKDCKLTGRGLRLETLEELFIRQVYRGAPPEKVQEAIRRTSTRRSFISKLPLPTSIDEDDEDAKEKQQQQQQQIEDEQLDARGFMELLLRVASVRYQRQTAISLSKKFKNLVSVHVLGRARRLDTEQFRDKLRKVEILEAFRRYRSKLRRIFIFFATSETVLEGVNKWSNTMNTHEFTTMLKYAKLCQPEGQLAPDDVHVIFSNICRETEDDAALIYPEFLESLAAVTCFRYPDPFRSLSTRIELFLTRDFIPILTRIMNKYPDGLTTMTTSTVGLGGTPLRSSRRLSSREGLAAIGLGGTPKGTPGMRSSRRLSSRRSRRSLGSARSFGSRRTNSNMSLLSTSSLASVRSSLKEEK